MTIADYAEDLEEYYPGISMRLLTNSPYTEDPVVLDDANRFQANSLKVLQDCITCDIKFKLTVIFNFDFMNSSSFTRMCNPKSRQSPWSREVSSTAL